VKASIIVLTYNNLEYTRQCVESIFAVTDEPDFELVLVDNASQDDTPAYLQAVAAEHDNVRLILNETNQGFARGNNLGVKASTGEVLVFLNNDTIVTRGWLKSLVAHLRDPQVGMVGPVTNNAGNASQIRAGYEQVDGLAEFAEAYTRAHAGQSMPVEMLAFQCVVIPRQVYDQVGPLDEEFNIGMFEDDDYAFRLHQAGYVILCAEDAYVHHWGSASFSQLDFATYWRIYRENLQRFERKWEVTWQPPLRRPEFLRGQLRQSLDSYLWILQELEVESQDLEDRTREINALQEQNERLTVAAGEFNTKAAEYDQKIYTLQAQVSDAQRAINWLNLELANIYQSNGWRFLQSLLRVRRTLIPEGSRREAWFRRFVHAARDVRLDNLRRLAQGPRRSSQPSAGQAAISPVLAAQAVYTDSGETAQDGLFHWPLVSVILPVYNHADMLEQAARSVLGSQYPNLELIILDDGSTDDVDPVLARLAADPRVRVYRQPNQKLPRALTHAHQVARGELITWTSSDNWMAPQALRQMATKLLEHPEAVLVYADVALIDEEGKPLQDQTYRPQNLDSARMDFVRLYRAAQPLGYEVDNYINACFLYRRTAAIALEGRYADDLRGLEDYDFWLRLQKAGQLIHLENPEPLYAYRVHTRTMSHELLSSERDLHLLRGRRLIEYEGQRREYCEQRWALTMDPQLPSQEKSLLAAAAAGLPVDLLAAERSAGGKLLRFLPADQDAEGRIFVRCTRDEWVLAWQSAADEALKELPFWKGVQPTPLVIKARDCRKNIWEFSQAGTRPILGCHLGLQPCLVDVPATRRHIQNNPWAFFVFVDIPGEEDNTLGKQLVDGLENAIYLGARPLWEPYITYACFDAVWLPPPGQDFLESQRCWRLMSVLAYGIARPLLLPQGMSSQTLPYQYPYQPRLAELDYLQELLAVAPERAILDRYLEAWTPAMRLQELLRYADAITQEDTLERPDFGISPIPVQAPASWTLPGDPSASGVKCALVVNTLDRGGLEELVANLALDLPNHGVDTVVLCTGEGGMVAERLKAQGVRVRVAAGQPMKMWEFLEQETPAVINSHQASLGFLKIAHEFRIPVIETIHNAYVWLSKAGWQEERQRSLYFTQAIAVSESVRQYYLGRNDSLATGSITVVPNGIAVQNITVIDRREAREKLGIPPDACVFLNLASYDGRKNQLGLLAAFEQVAPRYPFTRLICAGNIADPRYYEAVSQYHQGSGARDQVELHTFRQDTQVMLSAANCLVLDSFFEGWSLAASEAIVAGLPLIHSACGSAYELVGATGERGIVVPNPGGDLLKLDWDRMSGWMYQPVQPNTEALVRALQTMIESRQTWTAWREEIRNFGLRELASERMLAAYAQLLSRAGRERASRGA
jgi:GT2 family glycosyltransferase/glycosyltransferase involved in cell wall biosynthesis